MIEVPTTVACLRGPAEAGVFEAADVFVADAILRRAGGLDDVVATAIALVVKAVRGEHVCVVLDTDGVALLWRDADDEPVADPPPSDELVTALRARPDVCEVVDEGADVGGEDGPPLVLSGPRCYLRRYALLEQDVARRLRVVDDDVVAALDDDGSALASVGDGADTSQLDAVRRMLRSRVTVIAGGPGTGKTTTIALLLRTVGALDGSLRVALAAPTGKAAARLDEAVRAALGDHVVDDTPRARTLHRLLGIAPSGTYPSDTPIDADLVVVDEASMISLPVLAALFARTPTARVVLVGDPDQLASIEVGAVLADVVQAAGDGASHGLAVSWLTTAHRFERESGVATIADAVRGGRVADVEAAAAAFAELTLAEPAAARNRVLDDVVARAAEVVEAARAGDRDAALSRVTSFGLLCATKEGDGSTAWWRRRVEARLTALGLLRARDVDYVGRPLLVTRNDPLTGLMNGSVGVVVAGADGPVAVFDVGVFPLSSVPRAETMWALTIHKSQGSEFGEVVVSLPAARSPILTRELLYTAVTRSRHGVVLLAPPGSLETALGRRVARASGLAVRLSRPDRAT